MSRSSAATGYRVDAYRHILINLVHNLFFGWLLAALVHQPAIDVVSVYSQQFWVL
ncbi:hypothetical protein M1N05_02200 [Dehalococcoidales bacterium]|nr:hypothetical protein [Dehalococcoidales bacterium]